MPLDETIFGEGIYTPTEAARLIGATAQDVRRWTRGSGAAAPLWVAHYQFIEDTSELSFHDLIELRVVRALRRCGVSMQAIRYAIDLASRKFGIKRPLTIQRFQLLGVEILIDALENDGQLLSLSRRHPGQKIFADVVKQSLDDLEYEKGFAARWRPSFMQEIVLDPARAFGAPILDTYGISTAMLYNEHRTGTDTRSLATLYEIPLRAVNAALRYEDSLNRALGGNGQGSV